MSLSSRRAWIEIYKDFLTIVADFQVALLTESVDWNPHMAITLTVFDCRSPHGERGLKSSQNNQLRTFHQSLSSRRAWIEIQNCLFFFGFPKVALLTESVDWNKNSGCQLCEPIKSLSSRRAWIEIDLELPIKARNEKVALLTESVDWNISDYWIVNNHQQSLSSRRAWIEISSNPLGGVTTSSRSPHGERGLKYYHNKLVHYLNTVALLTESVDWN